MKDRTAPHVPQQAAHHCRRDRDTALGGRKSVPRNVEKNCGTAMAPARLDVPVEDQPGIIEPVIAHHPLVALCKRQPHGAIIGGVARGIAPSIICPDCPHHQCGWPDFQPVRPVKPAEHRHARDRRRTVAFALEDAGSAATQRTGEHGIAGAEQALGRMAGTAPDSHNSMAGFSGRRVFLHVTNSGARLNRSTNHGEVVSKGDTHL